MSSFMAKIEGVDITLSQSAGSAMPAKADGDGGGALAGLKVQTDLSACLMPLLEALHWNGDPRHVAEALPHFIDSVDITSFRNVMSQLRYRSRPTRIRLRDVDPRLLPCLFLPDRGDALVALGVNDDGSLRVFTGGSGEYTSLVPRGIKGAAYFFSKVEESDLSPQQQAKVGWFTKVRERFRGLVYQTLGITLILNLLALATPMFVMAVYDKVVATGSYTTLAYFAIGVGIAIGCDLVLRGIRARILAFVGARLDNLVGNAVFQKIMLLPPAFTERATIGAQVARIKDFESVRDFFTGPMALVFFELPFVLIFVIVIGFLGGPLAFIPLLMILLFAILGVVMAPFVRDGVANSARAGSRRQEFVVETLSGMRAVKYTGSEATWLDRYRELASKAAMSGYRSSQVSAIINSVSHVFMISAGVATVAFGVIRVFEGDMTVGSLVACMILVWRVLAPLQSGFLTLTRLTQVRSSITQINNLMNLKGERDPDRPMVPMRRVEGAITFARVSIRYSPEADPALVGVSFDMKPGEVMAVVGGNGSGKSTVIKLLAGMYLPQAGSIRLDNMDIRQLDTIELRHAIAYVPQTCQFFYGTIAQNLRLSAPTASVEDMEWACRKAGVFDDVMALEQGSGKWRRTGFEVRIGDSGAGQLPTSFQQRLNLARAYLKRSRVILFDEPGNGLDFDADKAFMRAVEEMKGTTTALIVTHRPSHLRLADSILWLEAGHVREFGPAEEVRKKMPKDFL